MRKRTIVLNGLLSFLIMAPAGVAGEILYAGIGNSAHTPQAIDGSLDILNQTNASPTVVGQPSSLGITGLVFDNQGNLWGSANSPTAGAPILEKISPATGAQISSVNLIDSAGGGALFVGDLAFQPVQNVLFGVTTSGVLYKINSATGVGTLVGDTGTGRTGGLGFAPNGTLYMAGVNLAGGDDFYTLNPLTGAILTTVPLSQFFDGLAVRPSDGAIFANLAAVDGIYTINPTSGVTTLVGTVGNGKASDLAFLVTAPEPGSWALMGAGLVALMAFQRRRRGEAR
jgi:hypothetical protein